MTSVFDRFLDPSVRGTSVVQLDDLPLHALLGLTSQKGQAVAEALGSETIGDLVRNRFVRRAFAMANAAADLGHDPGPDPAWQALFQTAPLATYQAHPSEFRLDFGPVYYRGRLDGTARLLVIGQDPAPNELIAHRAFVGASGQRLQGFFRKIGLNRSYLILNTFLYPVFGQVIGQLEDLLSDPDIAGFRNAVFDRCADENDVEAILCVGRAARLAADAWPGASSLHRVDITHPAAIDHAATLATWNEGLADLRARIEPEDDAVADPSTYGTDWTDADHEPIPRRDLPFGIPDWHGVGSHASRARTDTGGTDHRRIIWQAP
ncbi:MAG: uracil-DNA glycosylase family protein [Geminicoccaceae bacterium]